MGVSGGICLVNIDNVLLSQRCTLKLLKGVHWWLRLVTAVQLFTLAGTGHGMQVLQVCALPGPSWATSFGFSGHTNSLHSAACMIKRSSSAFPWNHCILHAAVCDARARTLAWLE